MKHRRTPLDSNGSAFAVWQAHIAAAKQNPSLALTIIKRCEIVLRRLKYFYKRLRSQSRHTRRFLKAKLAPTLAGAALVLAFSGIPTYAATINVDGTTCTLVDAITAANTDASAGGCPAGSGADTVVLQVGSTHTLTNFPDISTGITIEGNRATIEVVGGVGEFLIDEGVLALNDLTIEGYGVHWYSSPGQGVLAINNCTISGGVSLTQGTLLEINDSIINGGVYGYECDIAINNCVITGADDAVRISDNTAIIENSTISDNLGRGVHAYQGADVTIRNCTISGNRGGGVLASDSGGFRSRVTIGNSSISGNSAGGTGGGVTVFYSDVTIVNSTISGNSASMGGGAYEYSYGGLNLESCTITGNTAAIGGGGIASYNNVIPLSRCVLSGNTAPNFREALDITGYGGGFGGYNIVGYNGDAGVSASIALDPTDIVPEAGVLLSDILDPALALNGGPTLTHALVTGSPAVDAVPAAHCSEPFDQRGVARPQGVDCDIGAFEYQLLDTDGDGVPDTDDICPGGDDNVDTDTDGVPDYCDPCPQDFFNDSDGDGVCDSDDLCLGDDSTGDSDGDSLCNDQDPCFGGSNSDVDSDGVCDEGDLCFGDDASGNTDGDGVCNDLDQCEGDDATGDTDGDLFCDDIDACPLDAENDGDGDGLCESDDNCPTVANSGQSDLDEDGLGDACDPDIDGDGVANEEDNCVYDVNPEQDDFDGDAAGDACDTDIDGDGVLDADDACVPTLVDEVVNTDGCSISQLCPCEHPVGGDKWKNHGAYVSCVAHAAGDFVAAGVITEAQKDATVSDAAESTCGHKNK